MLLKLLIVCSLFTSLVHASESVSIVTYNVENLFDAKHDEGKNDWAYLPKDYPGKLEACQQVRTPRYRQSCLKSDWTEASYQKKLLTIKGVITTNNTKLPDMLALVEVENENTVKDLAKTLGYANWLVTTSPDKRGIDVALLYNESSHVKLVDSKEYEIHNKKGRLVKPTRNILEAQFAIYGEKTFIYVNHWPSQAAPASVRMEVARQIKKVINWKKIFNPKSHIILTGDFNTVDTDYPNPFQEYLYKGMTKFSNVHTMFKKSKNVTREQQAALPLGTYFYARKMNWNLLDLFFITDGLKDGQGLELDLKSYNIQTKGLTRDFTYNRGGYHHGTVIKGMPFRYNTRTGEGFSDHFPIKIELIKK